jgi:hypothetical protein
MPTTPLAITSLFNFTSDATSSAPDLTDESTVTAITLDSGAEANWWARYDGADLTGAVALRLDVGVNVISRDPADAFRLSVAIQDVYDPNQYSWSDARAKFETDLSDGLNDLILIIDDTWLAAPPTGGSVSITGTDDLATMLGFLDTTPVVHLQGVDGNPYVAEVHTLTLSVITAGADPGEINGNVARARRGFTP